MKLIANLHRFIAWDFKGGPPSATRASYVIAVLIALSPMSILERPYEGSDIVIFSITTMLSLSWLGFVAWRLFRITKAESISADRQYDRHGKFELPPEYSATESATSASRRKRRKRPRSE